MRDPTIGREKKVVEEMRRLYRDISYFTMNYYSASEAGDTETTKNCLDMIARLETLLVDVNSQVDYMISELDTRRERDNVLR